MTKSEVDLKRRIFTRNTKRTKRKGCPRCGSHNLLFGVIYIKGTKHVDGYTSQCQDCEYARAHVFKQLTLFASMEEKDI